MRVTVTPQQLAITSGTASTTELVIANTAEVIAGFQVRVLGADPGWVELPEEQISLFPGETRTLPIKITPPPGLPAGPRRIAVQVRELTPPRGSVVIDIDLNVPAARKVQMRVDPMTVTAGKHASFGLIVENQGNTVVRGVLDGDDPEAQVRFEFEPPRVALIPGDRALINLRATAKRRLAGGPTIRTLGLHLLDPPADSVLPTDADSITPATTPIPGPAAPVPPTAPAAPTGDRTPLAVATFLQKSIFTRGLLSMAGLLAAVTIFALVITVAMSKLVGQSAADRDLALQVAAARNQTSAGGNSSLSGTVRLLTSGQPAPAVSVSVFDASNTSTPIATTATDAAGLYTVGNLAAADYKISFQGAGFVQLWYPAAATDTAATAVTLPAATAKTGLDVVVGGVPASITGKVVGDDVAAATLYLERPPANAPTATTAPADNSAAPVGAASAGAVPPPDNGNALVQTVPIGSDGSFTLTDVPSPSVYDLVVTKAGYATATQRIDISAGEARTGVVITLAKGDGVIAGTVNSPTGPLGGVTVTATTGAVSVQTVSLSGGTTGALGAFTLRGLPTPASLTITATAPGYAAQTQRVTLSAGQKLTGLTITLPKSAGSLSGAVTVLPSNAPGTGVAVTVTGSQLLVQTETQSVTSTVGGTTLAPGHWTVGGLPLPGTYTVTFTRSDLATQTVNVALDASGHVTPGSQGTSVDFNGNITVSMQPATATVEGIVQQTVVSQSTTISTNCTTTGAAKAVGEVTVTLTSGTATFSVVTASVPAADLGHYHIDSVPPGTWTLSVQRSGTSPISTTVTLQAGQVFTFNPTLDPPAAICGLVYSVDGATPRAQWYVYIYRADQYPNVPSYQTRTDNNGGFVFPAVDAPENYVIVVQPSPSAAQAAAISVPVKVSEQLNMGTIQADPQ
ncbi:MAG: carboxypeptidase regulatory-like domain-containing protein [Actinomycetia bacterium]|nr:carboxypeptidase regulatory-like domain-containing protein [Actinomycetes bacterium]